MKNANLINPIRRWVRDLLNPTCTACITWTCINRYPGTQQDPVSGKHIDLIVQNNIRHSHLFPESSPTHIQCQVKVKLQNRILLVFSGICNDKPTFPPKSLQPKKWANLLLMVQKSSSSFSMEILEINHPSESGNQPPDSSGKFTSKFIKRCLVHISKLPGFHDVSTPSHGSPLNLVLEIFNDDNLELFCIFWSWRIGVANTWVRHCRGVIGVTSNEGTSEQSRNNNNN